jgi:hypothetical protein
MSRILPKSSTKLQDNPDLPNFGFMDGFIIDLRLLKNIKFFPNSRKAQIYSEGIQFVFRRYKFEFDTGGYDFIFHGAGVENGKRGMFSKGLKRGGQWQK